MLQKTLEGLRISPQQKHLWTLLKIDGDLPYRVQCAILIEGTFSLETFNQALQFVVNRHEILRTSFQCLPEMTIPLQVINDSGIVNIQKLDLQAIPQKEQEREIELLFEELKQFHLEPEKGPIMYGSLISLLPNKWVFLLGFSAVIADGFTVFNLVSEISIAYKTLVEKQELSDEPIQYTDLTEWKYELLESEDAPIGQAYWQKIDLGILNDLSCPFEQKSPTNLPFNPQCFSLKLNQDSIDRIASVAKRYRISNSTLLFACWQILICRTTKQTEIIFGLVCNGRKQEEIKPALGLLSKYLPLPCIWDDRLKFSQILTQVEGLVSEAFQWQDYFFWENYRESDRQQVVPFFPICFDFKEASKKYGDTALSWSIYKQYDCIDRFKIKLVCLQTSEGLNIEFHYDPSLFNLSDIKRLSECFETLLIDAIDRPDSEIGKLNILCERERQQVLFEFNNTQTDFPKNQCIHEIFEKQAEQTPNAIAVIFENQQLTYSDLNERANQLAHYLQKLGIKPEVLVGICVDRSLDMIVAILGILKAGGAYLPLDITMPNERLEWMLQDAKVPVLLTQKHLTHHISEQTAQIVCLDSDWSIIAQHERQNCQSSVTVQNLVYLIYTSGSTGVPKGVAIEHQQLLNYIKGILGRLDVPTGTSFATVSTFTADLGNTAIFPALCSGGCLHIISHERATDGKAFADYFRRHPIDCLKIVPSHLVALLRSSDSKFILPRKYLILGGEATSWDLIETVKQQAPHCSIVNHYGPTEATVGVLTYAVDRGNLRNISATVPLGRPIANTQIYILDAHQQPVPIGIVGEVYIGGASLARCYLNRSQLTTEKFIPNPFIQNSQARLYKTGDLARYLPQGNIEFLGRIDDQVKIRGFRVELGEIEAILRHHPAVAETFVTAIESTPGNKRIVAYFVSTEKDLPSETLREFLNRKLPDRMIPSAFVRLAKMPLTLNGKVDRKALPVPEETPTDGPFVAPRNSIEQTLCQIWAEVLNVKQVGIQDNFFELGGHSLLAVHLLAEIEKAFSKNLPLAALLQAPTVEKLSSLVVGEEWSAFWSSLVPIQPKGSKSPLFCIHAFGGNILSYQPLVRYLGEDQPVYGLQARGLDGQQAPHHRIEDMAADYVKEIQTIQPQGPYLLAAHSSGGVIAFEMAQQLYKQNQKVALLVMLDAYNPQLLVNNISLWRVLYINFRNLAKLELKDKWIFIHERASWLRWRIGKRISAKVNAWRGQDLPQEAYHNLQIVTAMQEARKQYVLQPYPDKITVFRTKHQPSSVKYNDSLGWDEVALRGVEIYDIPGTHLSMLTEPCVQITAEQLQACVQRAQVTS